MQINENARESLLNEISGISDENFNKKPSNEEWSIKQILEHLFLMESVIAQTIAEKLENGEIVNAKVRPIEASTNRDIKVDAPQFAIPSDDFAAADELKMNLNTSHQKLHKVVETADEKQLEEKGFHHPFFGQMSLKQWVPFLGYHEMRHILQIKEVKEKLGIEKS